MSKFFDIRFSIFNIKSNVKIVLTFVFRHSIHQDGECHFFRLSFFDIHRDGEYQIFFYFLFLIVNI